MSKTFSKKFNTVKRFYDRSLWSKSRVHDAVDKMWITKEEYKIITGEDFVEEV